MGDERHQSPNLAFETKCEAFRQRRWMTPSRRCAGKSVCVSICMSVCLSGTRVNQGTFPSSACYKGREGGGGFLSERKLQQNPNQDRKSAAANRWAKSANVLKTSDSE